MVFINKNVAFVLSVVFAVLCAPMPLRAQQTVYSWQSVGGTVVENGGTLEHFNQNGYDKRNIKCGDFYTFVLNGDYVYVNANYNVDECSYMKVTLADGNAFREGDEIVVTAMRNNVADRPASIYFLFRATRQVPLTDAATGLPIDGEYEEVETDVPLVDTNVWNNLGLGKDDSFSGGSTYGVKAYTDRREGAFAPSTHTFVVPKEADGAKSVRLTRYATGNLLFVSNFTVRRPESSAITVPTAPQGSTGAVRKYVKGNRLVISRGGKTYNADGTLCSGARF